MFNVTVLFGYLYLNLFSNKPVYILLYTVFGRVARRELKVIDRTD